MTIEDEKIFEQFKQQVNTPTQIQEVPREQVDTTVGIGFDNQGQGLNPEILKTNPVTNQINQVSQNTTEVSNVCPQCGTIHPPLPPGEKCPNALASKTMANANLNDESVNKYLTDLKNIVLSNISKKQIKDGNKFFQYLVVELTKLIEKYTES